MRYSRFVRPQFTYRLVMAALVVAIALQSSLQAATQYWDTDGATTGTSSVGGAWTGALWSTNAAGTAATAAWTSGNDAVFSAGTNGTGAFIVTVSGTQNVSSVSIEEGTVRFNGGTISFSDATPDFTVAAGLTTTVASLIGGTNGITKNGSGTLILSGNGYNTYTGVATITDGMLVLDRSVQALMGPVVIGDNVGLANSAVVRINQTTQLSPTSAVTINSDGLLDLANGSGDNIGSLSGSGNVALGTLALTTGGANTNTLFSGSISGAATSSFFKTGNGTLTLTGNSSYDAMTNISFGVINIRSNTALGSAFGATAINTGAALELQGNITVSGENLYMSGTGVSNNGALRNIAGNNTWTGIIDFGPTGEIQSDAGLLTISGDVTSGNYGLTVDGAGDTTLSGTIALGTGAVTKTGSGTLVQSGANTYKGGTTVSNGTLMVTNATGSGTGTGAVTVAAGATLGGTGTISGAVNLNSANSRLTPGVSGTGTLTLGATTLGNTTQLDYQLGTASDKVVVNGALTLDGVLNVTNSGGFGGASSYRLFDYTGGLTNNALTMGTVIMGYDYNVSTATANQVNLLLTATGKAYWDGANTTSNGAINGGTGTWNTSSTNWTTSTGNGNGVWIDNLTPVFTSTGGTVTVAQPVSVHGMEFGVGGYTLTGSTITLTDTTAITATTGTTTIASTLAGSSGLTKAGAGTLVLSGVNTYTGTTSVSGGILNVANNSALGSSGDDTTVSTGGTLELASGIALTENIKLSGTGSTGSNGALRAVAGNTTVNGTITVDTNSTIRNDGTLLTINGRLRNAGGGELTTTGPGTILFNYSASSAIDGLNVAGGKLILDSTSGGGTLSIGSIPGPGIEIASGATLQIGNGGTTGAVSSTTIDNDGALVFNRSNTYAPTFLPTGGYAITGTGSVTQAGSGTLQLTQASNYSGATYVNNGILRAEHNDALGSAAGATTVASGATLALGGGVTITKNGDLNLAGTGASGSFGALQAGGASGQTSQWLGQIRLTANATIGAADNLLILGDDTGFTNTLYLGSNNLTVNTTSATGVVTTYDPYPSYILDPANVYLAMQVTGSGGIIKTGAGTLNLTSFPDPNSYTGDTVVTGGKMIFDGTSGFAIISSANVIVGNASGAGADDSVILQQGQLSAPSAAYDMMGSYAGGTSLATTSMTVYEDGLFNINGGSAALHNLTMKGGHVTSAAAGYSPVLTLTGGVTTTASTQTSLIDKAELALSANGFTFNVADGTAADDLRVDSIIHSGSGFTGTNASTSLNKLGTGTMVLTGNSNYLGVTDIQAGVVNLRSSTGLGQGSTGGSTDNGTVVRGGAQLQLQGGINVTDTLTINGTGISNTGALRNVAGTNTYTGSIIAGSAARITADASTILGISNGVNGAGFALQSGGAGDINYNGPISGSGTTFTKTDSGTVTFAGSAANTFSGALTVNDGTLNLNKTAGINAVGTSNTLIIGDNIGAAGSATVALKANNQMPDTTDVTINSDGRLSMGTASDTISQLSGTGILDVGSTGNLTLGTDNSSSVFGGTITGSGSLTKAGTGSLTLNQDISYSGTMNLNGGTLVLNNSDLSVTNLNINANSVIDFGATGDSHLFANTLNFLNTSVTLNIINWTKGVDAFYATFWPGATQDLYTNGNTPPMNQITFSGWTANDTGWDSYDDQIYPNVPEPSTYGMIFIGVSLSFVGYRRWRSSKSAAGK